MLDRSQSTEIDILLHVACVDADAKGCEDNAADDKQHFPGGAQVRINDNYDSDERQEKKKAAYYPQVDHTTSPPYFLTLLTAYTMMHTAATTIKPRTTARALDLAD